MGVIRSDSNNMVCHRALHHFSDEDENDFSVQSFGICREKLENPPCDACMCCADRCKNSNCEKCCRKRVAPYMAPNQANIFGSANQETFYTMCQVRRHDNVDSGYWLTVGDTIYDATEYIANHPGGEMSIIKKAGGKSDCTIDFDFHSKNARRIWRKYKIGKLCNCPGHTGAFGTSEQCIIS